MYFKQDPSDYPTTYLLVLFSALAIGFVVLPGCSKPNSGDAESRNPEVFIFPSGLRVPTCGLPGLFEAEPINLEEATGCDGEHYHGLAVGFMPTFNSFAFVEREDDDEGRCGQGKKSDIEPTQTRINISEDNLDEYEQSEFTPNQACWY